MSPSSHSQSDRINWREVCVITAVYVPLIILITWPTASQLTTHMPGNSTDTLLHYWNGWWVRTALSQRQSPFFTPLLFYPHGVSLVTHNMAWFNIIPWIILSQIFGGILSYNIILLSSLLFCGWAAYLLARRMTHNHLAAFLAGIVYLSWPFRISQLDHPNLLATYWVPIFMLGLINTLERSYWRDTVLTGIAFALVGYTRWQILIPVTFMGLSYTLFRADTWWPRTQRQLVASRIVVAAIIGSVLLLPPAALFVSDQFTNENSADVFMDRDELIMQTDLLAYVTPPAWNPLFERWTQPLYGQYYPDRSFDRHYPAYLGFGVLLLSVFALWRRGRECWPWLGVGVVLIGLATGPALRLNGVIFENAPTLYRLLMPLRFVRLIRVPDRFNMFLALPAAMLTAHGLLVWLAAIQRQRFRGRRLYPALLTTVLAVLITAEYLIIPVKWHDVSYDKKFYYEMAAERSEYAVIYLPFRRRGKDIMFDQTFHTHPVVQGNASRLPDDVYSFVYSNPWLTHLKDKSAFPLPVGDAGKQLTRLANDGIGYLILQKKLFDPSLIAHWKRYLIEAPRFEDERVAIYSTAPEVGRDVISLEEPVKGLNQIAVFLPTDCLQPGQVLGLGSAWANTHPLEERFDVRVSLLEEGRKIAQTKQFSLTDLGPNETWPPHTIGQGYYPILLDPDLMTGRYIIQMQLVRISQDALAGDPWSAGTFDVQSTPCWQPAPDRAKEVNATFGNKLRLRGFVFDRQEKQFMITLHWLALEQLQEDYKIFVHLVGDENSPPVAQFDSKPLGWQYPTSFWWSGQKVADTLPLNFEDVPPGIYTLVVGAYSDQTGVRLPVVDIRGEEGVNGLLVLLDGVLVNEGVQ